MDNNEYDEIPETEEQEEVQTDNLTSEENSYEAMNNRQRYIENETTQENQRRSSRPNILNMARPNYGISDVIKRKMGNLMQRNKIIKSKKEETEHENNSNEANKDAKQEKNSKSKVNFNNVKSLITTNKETKKRLIQKKIIAFIMKNPWVLIIILSLFLLLIILIIILGGAGGADDNDYDISLSNSDYCSDFPMKDTTLSRSEFISLMEKNLIAKQGSTSGTQTFVKEAGTIYDIATKNGVNPELVVVRAIAEGFTPGGNSNNYWGLGVYNGQSSGASYASFSAGVLAFVTNVSQYDTIVNMMSRYAYIGDYWANAGSNSLGGCQFISYTKEFYENSSRANEIVNICSKNNCPYSVVNGTAKVTNATKCTKTNEEDQLAYAKYNASTMGKIRTSIFEVEPNSCTIEGNVDIANINDIKALGTLIVQKAIATFDSYEYSQARRNETGYVDCSSMVDRAYRQVGISYLYTSWGNSGTTVTESDWCRENGAVVNSTNVNDFLPGDLIFNNNWGHVVMYAGNGQIFEASGHYPSNPSSDVRLTSYYGGTVMVCRPLRVYFREKGMSSNE